MLELIFRIFLEWLYSLLGGVWEFIAEGLLDIMSLDFAYLQTHVPIIPQMSQLLLAVGWALLLGNLVFQALKSMAAGLGFEGEDPKLLFSRTFVFAFLLMASPQICRIGLDLTSNIMDLLKVPSAVNVGSVDEGVFGPSAITWLMVIICNVIVMFRCLAWSLRSPSGMSSWLCSPSPRRWLSPWAAVKTRRPFFRAGAGCSAVCAC